jgi:MATE family multidrug resistance protein
VAAGGLISVSILVAHARGADENHRIGPILRGGFLLALLASVPPMLLLWYEHPLLLMIGEPPALADAIARYDRILLFAMPASLIMATQRSFLAAMGRPYMVMAVALVAVVVNGLLNYGLIHGAWGLPRLGYIGSCTATLITLWAMMLAIGLEMRFTPILKPFRLFGRIEWHVIVELVTLGWPIAFITALEIVLFSTSAMLIGRFGETQLAAHQISIGISSVTFMVPYAIAQAVNVRVGYYTGQNSPPAARRDGFAAFTLGVGFMATMAATLLSIPDVIAGLYITKADPTRGEVIALAVQLLTVAAFFQVFDGAQTIAAGALRGLKDTRVPAVAASIGYWGLGFPIAWFFGVHLGYGALGIWWGLAAGLASVAILLSVRFIWLSDRLIFEINRKAVAISV